MFLKNQIVLTFKNNQHIFPLKHNLFFTICVKKYFRETGHIDLLYLNKKDKSIYIKVISSGVPLHNIL